MLGEVAAGRARWVVDGVEARCGGVRTTGEVVVETGCDTGVVTGCGRLTAGLARFGDARFAARRCDCAGLCWAIARWV